jgi:S1/P1 Nuclease
LWDSGLIHHIGGSDRVWVDRVEKRITPETEKNWSSTKVEDWTNESLSAAKRAYFYPSGSSTALRSGSRLGDDYARFAAPILEEQMARASVRLANELNAIFR